MHRLMGTKKTYYLILILLFFLCFFIHIHLSFGADSISANQSLSGDQTIVSSGGIFELGFFTPGKSSSKYYIGIWFKKVSEQTVVWVANRERPVIDKYSSELKVVDGNLVLFDHEAKTQVWSTHTNFTTFPCRLFAVLHDEGNLVLRNGSSTTSALVWQSLDYPSHTWLPGSKISYDKRTNSSKGLTSWKNAEDPAPGLYSLEVDPVNNQSLILRNKSKLIWKSGPWDGEVFTSVPEMRPSSYSLFNFTYISNENETSFSYSSTHRVSSISREVIDYSGQYQLFLWSDNTNNTTSKLGFRHIKYV